MESYPEVAGEWETLEAVVAGKSITRYGDGEFRLAMGAEQNASQVQHPRLQRELRQILITPQDFCLVGIPTMDRNGPKFASWSKYERKYPPLLSQQMRYYSAFISRPDSAAGVDVPAFFDRVQSLWAGREIVLVRGSERSLVAGRPPLDLASRAHEVLCARRDAYAEIDRVEAQVLALGVQRVILCAGAMATVLTYRLARAGLHAIDLGHIGMFWRRHEREKPQEPA